MPDDREVTGAEPAGEKLDARDVRFSYVEGRDVLHGVDLDVGVGERIAMVGPSGAGKSTLGRLLAGIHPPRTGAVTVGGVGLVELPLDELRGHVALVTQEHHVFVGTLRENLALAAPPGATDDDIRAALDAVDALEWVEALPDGLDTVVGSGGRALTAAQAQQVALARLVLADPHTLVLDEATSLIDPRAARHLERSLAAVLARPHRDRDRAPAVLGPRRRPGRGGRGRRDLRARLARRAGRGRRVLRRALGLVERQALKLAHRSGQASEASVASGASAPRDRPRRPRRLRNPQPERASPVDRGRTRRGSRPVIRMPECTLYFRLIEISTAVSGSSWRASRSLPALMPSRPVTARASSMATALPSSESPTQRTSSSR